MQRQNTYKFAVFGQPVAHSLSPRIHRHFGEQLDMAVDYRAIECDAHSLPAALEAFRAEGGIGANLTVPLKQSAIGLCRSISADARRARAVNTLRLEQDGWHGFNTDGGGLLLDFDRLELKIAHRRVLIVGAGGATAGILGALLDRRPDEVCIANRTPEKSERLADRFGPVGNVCGTGFGTVSEQPPYDLLIQSTSAGHAGEELPLRRSWLSDRAQAYDLNYGPAHEAFSRWCQACAVPVTDGTGMLVGQAALSFEIWTGHRPDIVMGITNLLKK